MILRQYKKTIRQECWPSSRLQEFGILKLSQGMQGKLNSDAAGFDEVRAHAAYSSPEGLNFFVNPNEHPVTTASDLWSVGCLVLELLVGQPVFVQPHELDEPHQQLSQKVLRRHTYWVHSCLQPCLLCCSCFGTTASLHAFPCMLPCPTKKGCTMSHQENMHHTSSPLCQFCSACRTSPVAGLTALSCMWDF